MSSSGQFKIKKVWKMLKECAEGYTKEQGAHKWLERYGDKDFLDLPLGPHVDRSSGNTFVEKGQLRSLVRHFNIEECAKKHFNFIITLPKPDSDEET